MSKGQNLGTLYVVPVAACALIALGMRVRFPENHLWTLLINSLYPAIAVATCVMTVIGLRRAARQGSNWLPSFAALTVLEALGFFLFCISAAMGVKLLQSGDGREVFVLGLALPALIVLCSLLTIAVFAVASLSVRMMPGMREHIVPAQHKAKAALAVHITVLCTGLGLACGVCVLV